MSISELSSNQMTKKRTSGNLKKGKVCTFIFRFWLQGRSWKFARYFLMALTTYYKKIKIFRDGREKTGCFWMSRAFLWGLLPVREFCIPQYPRDCKKKTDTRSWATRKRCPFFRCLHLWQRWLQAPHKPSLGSRQWRDWQKGSMLWWSRSRKRFLIRKDLRIEGSE